MKSIIYVDIMLHSIKKCSCYHHVDHNIGEDSISIINN